MLRRVLNSLRDGASRSEGSDVDRWLECLPSTSSKPGESVTTNFFSAHDRFVGESTTAANELRLNLRHDAIFVQNEAIFAGARVLDLASHDGRWTFAAVEAGAAHVTGYEARREMVRRARKNLLSAGVPDDRYRFIPGDMFKTLAEDSSEYDVVLCLGFLYHTLRYNELFQLMTRGKPKYLLIDTSVVRAQKSIIELQLEDSSRRRNAVADEFSHDSRVLTGRPSVSAVEQMCRAYGYQPASYSDWRSLLRDNVNDPVDREFVADYASQRRVTILFERA